MALMIEIKNKIIKVMIMHKSLFLLTLLLFFRIAILAQNKDSVYMFIACSEISKEKTKDLSFILEVVNNSSKSVILPNKIVSGPAKNLPVNLGFEILFITNSDTTNVLDTHLDFINPGPFPKNNNYTLLAKASRLIKIRIRNSFFSEKGAYLIRFVLKKKLVFEKSLKLQDNIYTAWKMIEVN